MSIDRRSFFAATGACALPAWLARAFGLVQDGAGSDDRTALLREARRRADARGKPLLLLLVPEPQEQMWQRGTLLGSFLNHATDDALCDLAMCEVACASAAEARKVLGKVDLDEAAAMVLVEPGSPGDPEPPRVTTIAADEPPPDVEFGPFTPQAREAEERLARERNRKIAGALHAAVAGDRGTLATRADAGRATLSDGERDALESLFAGRGTPEAALLVRAAAVVCMGAEAPRRDGDRQRLRRAVAAAARHTWLEHPPAGAKWARHTGCGSVVEGDKEALLIACGMGHVPALGERFLWFFSKR
jgi:hypothetical protein